MGEELALTSERLSVPDSAEAVNELFVAQGWSDGLPIVPPTPERVRQMLSWIDRDAQEVIAELPPGWGEASVEKIAINAVLAGCRPQYLPVLVTAVAAMVAPELNLYGLQATTHPCGVLLLLNGPIAKELGVNAGHGAFGPGHLANATIGRAIRLILMNVGGALPGTTDKATQGQPCKYSFCAAENEDESPWPPFQVDRGFDPAASTVTLVGAEGPHNINDHVSTTAEGVLITTADTMAIMGCNNAYAPSDLFVAFGPEHAAIIARDGLAKADVRSFLYAEARIPFAKWRRGGMYGMLPLPKTFDVADEEALIPMVGRPEDINVVVIGGAGRHSSFIPTFGLTRSVTRAITLRDGRPARSIQQFRP